MNRLWSKTLFSILLISFVYNGFGQKKNKLLISSDTFVELSYNKEHSDSLSIVREINDYLTLLRSKGYISSYISSLEKKESTYSCFFTLGDLFSWQKLTFSPIIKQIQGNYTEFNPNYFDQIELQEKIRSVLKECQNKGYPFAQVFFDSVKIKDGKINANLELSLNEFIIIDSIVVKGGVRTSLNYIEKQIGIWKGSIYNEKAISEINKKIRNIAFVESIRSPEVYFTPGNATLVLYLKDKTASRFDGILGLNSDEITGKIGVVGDLKVDLLNTFKKGENIILNWEQAKTKSQNYLIRFSYPFLFKTRLGLETGLNYYRQDTTFANLDADFGFSFFLDENQKAGVSMQFIESNSLLSSDNTLVGVPSTNSVKTTYYGVDYSYNSLDYRLNPRRGLTVDAVLKTGRKTIVKNQDYLDEDYENIEEKATQIKTDVTVSYFLPLFKKSTVLLKLQSGNVFGDNIFLNELYQVGGLKTIRGFNQQSILASNYYIGTSEFRYLFDRNSAVFGYLDYAYYENKSTSSFESDTPFGFGVGANFQTKAGIFSLSYGLGKQKGNPILFKNGKIHFGFVSLF